MLSQAAADRVFRRIVALDRTPPPKSFTMEILRRVHAFIFRDARQEFRPGRFREPVMRGHDWVKYRRLDTSPLEPVAIYSRMDAEAFAGAKEAMAKAGENIRAENPEEASRALAALYAELDFLHPFQDGNSRSIRSFTRLLARAHGLHIAWEEFSPTAAGRDKLYIARDRAVDAIGLDRLSVNDPSIVNEIGWFLEESANEETLEDILGRIVKPLVKISWPDEAPTQPSLPFPLGLC